MPTILAMTTEAQKALAIQASLRHKEVDVEVQQALAVLMKTTAMQTVTNDLDGSGQQEYKNLLSIPETFTGIAAQ